MTIQLRDRGPKIGGLQLRLVQLGYPLYKSYKGRSHAGDETLFDEIVGPEVLGAARLFEQDRHLPISPNGQISDRTEQALGSYAYKPRGADISEYQTKDVDLVEAARGGLRFIYQRATMGRTGVDDTLKANIAGAKQAASWGLRGWGVYHFWYPERDPIQQAERFYKISVDAGVDPAFCLPPVWDVEQPHDLSHFEVAARLRASLVVTSDLWKRRACIYTSERVYTDWGLDKEGYPEHLAGQHEYLWQVWWRSSKPSDFYPFNDGGGKRKFQQTGFAKGLRGFNSKVDVDRDLFEGTDAELSALMTDIF